MNTIDEQDQEIKATLRRAAGHLARRGSEYLEHPVTEQPFVQVRGARGRRLLVGTAAAATLCVTALAGSFIGGTSSGKVDVAKAAWSAVPSAPSAEQVKKVQLECGLTTDIIAQLEDSPPASIPSYMLEPALIDVRGTTITAVYFTWRYAFACMQFADGSVQVKNIPMMNPGEDAWKTPSVVEVVREDMTATMIVGFLPPNISDSNPNSTGESDKIIESQWEAHVEGPGVEKTQASINKTMGRFVSWIPAVGTYDIAFTLAREFPEQSEKRIIRVGPATRDKNVWTATPVTTVPVPPNG
jgi:hypothetical protein